MCIRDRSYSSWPVTNQSGGWRQFALQNIDGDNDQDFFVCKYPTGPAYEFFDRKSNSKYTSTQLYYNLSPLVTKLAVGHLNQDSLPDFVGSIGYSDGELYWFETIRKDSVSRHLIHDSLDVIVSLYIVDMDGDGDNDIVTGSDYSITCLLYTSRCV